MGKRKPKLPKARKAYSPDEVLAGWREMRQAIPYMNETELKKALDEEMAKPDEDRRGDIVLHLHRRYSKLRQKRELAELLMVAV